ncbi:MAG: ubiquinol-cytochrome c reductase iron-sulfur subunit [Acidobacteriota bacterium]
MNRRNLLASALYGAAALIASGLGIPAAAYLLVPPKRTRQAQWADAGDVSEIEPGSPRQVVFRRTRVDGWKISSEKAIAWMVKGRDGSITAYSPACTHLGCAYRWEAERGQFLCPCHGSVFGIDGKVIHGPAVRPLDRYEIRLTGTRAWLGAVRS